jgi:hypothetical protein
MEGDEFLDVN